MNAMKQRWTALLLCAVMLLALPVTAAAAEGESGFYQIGTAERVEIVPLTAQGEAVAGVARDVDGSGAQATFYPASSALRVTVSGTVPGMWYLMTVSSGETVYFADQQTGGASVVFDAAFVLPEQQTDLQLRIGSNEPGFVMIVVPLSYTPAAAQETPEPGGASGGSGESSGGSGESSGGSGRSSGGSGGSITTPETSTTTPDASTDVPEPPAPEAPCPRDDSCPMAAYSDLDVGSWYHDGVHFVLEHGIMNGVGEGSFDPDGTTSRAMLVTMLWRLEGSPRAESPSPFFDVWADSGAWYYDAVLWAAENGIVEGNIEGAHKVFRPDGNITREQMAAILYRYAKYKGVDAQPADSVNLGGFIDAERISGWARDAVQWAVDTGLLTGTGAEKLSPETNAFRAQVATLLMRFMTRAAA